MRFLALAIVLLVFFCFRMRCSFRNQPNDSKKYLPRLSAPRLSHLLVRSLACAHGDTGSGDRAGLARLSANELALLFRIRGLCLGLPRVIFSPLGGAIADRADRKVLFVITQSAFLLMALFLGVMDYLGTITVWRVLTVSSLTGFFVSFEQPVRQSILHHLVPRSELANAVTLYQMVFNGSMLFGPSVGGVLIAFIDTQGCFFLATIGNLIVLLTIFMIH